MENIYTNYVDFMVLINMYNECVQYWKKQGYKDVDAFEHAYNDIECIKHYPYVPVGYELDKETVKNAVLSGLTEEAVSIDGDKATVTLAEGIKAVVTVVTSSDTVEVDPEVTAAKALIDGQKVTVATNDVATVLAAIKE